MRVKVFPKCVFSQLSLLQEGYPDPPRAHHLSLPPMDTHTYPGRGLSLSQLIFALNEELKRVAYSPLYVTKSHFGPTEEQHADYLRSFTLEAISQLDRDTSIALAAIREWRNSFAPINCIPTDILSLIPTQLSSQKDHFRTASVCRHWRGVLLKHGALWSRLFLKKGEEYVSTLLERAKGSPLHIISHGNAPGAITLISPHARQIRSLDFILGRWQPIAFSKFNFVQLPLLRTLRIVAPDTPLSRSQPYVMTPPSPPFFGSSINLDRFVFNCWKLSLLSHFVFPNLTTFELSSDPGECSALYLLNFLEASPTLQTVEIEIPATVTLTDVPQEMVVTLPNVKTFSLDVANGPTTHAYDIAAHISCPCARYTSLVHRMDNTDMSANLKIFPTSLSLQTIVHQYTTSPTEEITLEIKNPTYKDIECFLTFLSSDAAAVRLGFNVTETGVDRVELNMPSARAEMGWEIFSQALTTIPYLPLPSYVKRLHIEYKAATILDTDEMLARTEEVRKLFDSLGPLDKLTISGCDLHIFFANFLDKLEPPIVFPQINEFTILRPSYEETEYMYAIVELAKVQHSLGIPFERVTVSGWGLPAGMAEDLGRWVGAVGGCEVSDEEDEW